MRSHYKKQKQIISEILIEISNEFNRNLPMKSFVFKNASRISFSLASSCLKESLPVEALADGLEQLL